MMIKQASEQTNHPTSPTNQPTKPNETKTEETQDTDQTKSGQESAHSMLPSVFGCIHILPRNATSRD